ncbi:response regulator transcription factor [Miniphocaeibacter massiliensis]|uniref:response regulator transcription factor n=1 Tax=Miniphocaeibacter massiliensis TaxID=2041841 RepID=UPI000C1C427B|nr:response regulator transcription factor [Miniphocaeibacter massiliensis]
MKSYNILVCEDDIAISNSIEIFLKNQNYNIFKAYDGLEGLKIFNENKIDLVIMDLMMPNLSGEETIMRLREKTYVPIIILSAKSEDMDKITGLNIGADDYITKPFNSMELIARVNSAIRRFYSYQVKKVDDEVIEIGGVKLNTFEKTATVDDRVVNLTSIEYNILELLMKNPNRIFSIDEIYERIWNEPALDSKTVTVHIRRIREKIEIDPKNPMYIKVAWGLGYKFEGD